MWGFVILLLKLALFVGLFLVFMIIWFLIMEPVYNTLNLEKFLDLESFLWVSLVPALLLFSFFRWWKNKPKICEYGEPLPWMGPFFKLSTIDASDHVSEISYCREHFFDEVVKKFTNAKPVVFCKPLLREGENNVSAFFTESDWKTNEFLNSDWQKLKTLLQNTRNNRSIFWNENSDILFPGTMKDSFFKTENPLLTPLTPQELKEKLRKSFAKFTKGTYTLMTIPSDIGIIITP